MPKASLHLWFLTSTKDFFRNRLFAWAELSFGKSTFEFPVTPVVHCYYPNSNSGGCSQTARMRELALHHFVPSAARPTVSCLNK
jgi:hypothetical protein